jgi:hypothetical protein
VLTYGTVRSGHVCDSIYICFADTKRYQAWRSVYIEQYRMVTTKKCAWGTCKSDSRYPDRLKRNSNGADIFFYIFLGLDTVP